MKKFLRLFTILVLSLSLVFVASCGKKDKENEGGGNVEPVQDITTEQASAKLDTVAAKVINDTEKASLSLSVNGTFSDLTSGLSFEVKGSGSGAAVLGPVQEIPVSEEETINMRSVSAQLNVDASFGPNPLAIDLYLNGSGFYGLAQLPKDMEALLAGEEVGSEFEYTFNGFEEELLIPELAALVPAEQLAVYLEMAKSTLAGLPLKSTQQGSKVTMALSLTEENFASVVRQLISTVNPEITAEELTETLTQIAAVISVTSVELSVVLDDSSLAISLDANVKVMNYRVKANAALELKLGEGEVHIEQAVLDSIEKGYVESRIIERIESFYKNGTEAVQAATVIAYRYGFRVEVTYSAETDVVTVVSSRLQTENETDMFNDSSAYVTFNASTWDEESPIYYFDGSYYMAVVSE